MFGTWMAAVAAAGELEVSVTYQPPAEIVLFDAAVLSDVRATVKGGDCSAAIAAGLAQISEELGEGAFGLRVVRSVDDFEALPRVTCRQRMAGDNVSASVVEFTALAARPGPNKRYPTVSAERAVAIAEAMTSVDPSDRTLAVLEADERLWMVTDAVSEPAILDTNALDSNRRGALLYDRYVSPWVVRWARTLERIPELDGASIEITVSHEDPLRGKKSRQTEIFRFFVPTDAALVFARGESSDEALVRASRVERAIDRKKRDFLQFLLDIEDADLPTETDQALPSETRTDLRDLDEIDIEDE